MWEEKGCGDIDGKPFFILLGKLAVWTAIVVVIVKAIDGTL